LHVRLALVAVITTSLALIAAGAPAEAAAVKLPDKIVSVTAKPGPGVGEVTVKWRSTGRNTTGYDVETALTAFSKVTSSPLPWTGRNSHHFTASGTKRSITLSARQAKAAGAASGTGNHLFFRVTAVNKTRSGTKTRAFGPLRAVIAKPAAPKAKGTNLRVASFNIRSARNRGNGRPWLKRAGEVAAEIKKANADVVALQEVTPGRADGRSGPSTGSVPRQTNHLVSKLGKIGAGKYKMVQLTSYVKPGTTHGSQGARILYNSSQVSLVSSCPENTGKRQYSTACSFSLPIASGDKASNRRSAAYARFKDKESGKKFLLVSVHLDFRQSGNAALAKKYDALRKKQMATVNAKIAKVRRGNEPVIVAGDYNSWQNRSGGNAPHDYLVGQGYYDTAAAQTTLNRHYPTYNGFKKVLAPSPQGFGNRLDNILVKGLRGARRYANVTKPKDSSRPSDHSLIYADLAL